MKKHPLLCDNCGQYAFLEFTDILFQSGNKSLYVETPNFHCRECGHRHPLKTHEKVQGFVDQFMPSMREGEEFRISCSYLYERFDAEEKFERFSHLGFEYDPKDYYFIPGLEREIDVGYLTPVFFDKDILLYYNNHPDFSVILTSFSSGNIYYLGEPFFSHGFGINRNGKIFKWLGDLNDDFRSPDRKPHLKRFQASNIESDHDIFSKFYISQIPFVPSHMFPDSDNELKIFRELNKLNQEYREIEGFELFKIAIDDLRKYYKPPILEERQQIFESYLSLTKLMVENINMDSVKEKVIALGKNKKDIENKGTIKILEVLLSYRDEIKDIYDFMTPFYVLYDLRVLHGHLTDKSFNQRYESCKTRLGLRKEATDLTVYEKLIAELIKRLEELKIANKK